MALEALGPGSLAASILIQLLAYATLVLFLLTSPHAFVDFVSKIMNHFLTCQSSMMMKLPVSIFPGRVFGPDRHSLDNDPNVGH